MKFTFTKNVDRKSVSHAEGGGGGCWTQQVLGSFYVVA